jgi:NADPH:quinone reductase-like Zn-dependent oxidoreductase
MTMTHDNSALWLTKKGGRRLESGPAPSTPPKAGEIVVRNRAIAVNPVDWMTVSIGGMVYPWLTYPAVLGSDVAGDVVEVGPGVTRFQVGDRVVGMAVGVEKNRNAAAEGAFQLFTVLLEHMASPLPDGVSYENAAVLPLTLSTAACGLFEPQLLGLDLPTAKPVATGQTVVIWGGSTSVGSNAIQLAVAAGYDVIATASPKNFDYVRGLGASQAFDYNNDSAVADILGALTGKTLAGVLAVGTGSTGPCIEIAAGAGAGAGVGATAGAGAAGAASARGSKRVATASVPVTFDALANRTWTRLPVAVPILVRFVLAQARLTRQARKAGVTVGSIWGATLKDNFVGPAIYRDFLPRALADGSFRAAPEPLVVGAGLDAIAGALDSLHEGVSARKIVVTL